MRTRVLFEWDPVTGQGQEARVGVALCRQHCHWLDLIRGTGGMNQGIARRLRIVRGWLGAANEHGYGISVFKHEKKGWEHAAWWWAQRIPMGFGSTPGDEATV